jgi:hypothetical protein
MYLKNTSLYLHALSVLLENTIHSLIFFDGVLPCCLVEAGVAKSVGESLAGTNQKKNPTFSNSWTTVADGLPSLMLIGSD